MLAFTKKRGCDVKLNEIAVKDDLKVYDDLLGVTVNIGIVDNPQVITKDTQDRAWDTYFDIGGVHVRSLQYCPKVIKGWFQANNNPYLESLEHGPTSVGGSYDVSNTGISSLDGFPAHVGSILDFSECHHLHSLHDIHRHTKNARVVKFNARELKNSERDVLESVLGLILIEGLERIEIYYGNSSRTQDPLHDILNSHLGRGRSGLIDCQNELLDAGLDEFAKL